MTTMRDDATKISISWAIPSVVAVAGALVGVGLGFAAPPICRWAVDTLPTVPGPIELLSELTTAWSLPILTVLGIVAGTVLAMMTVGESLTVTVDSDGVLLDQDDDELYVPRTKVAGSISTTKIWFSPMAPVANSPAAASATSTRPRSPTHSPSTATRGQTRSSTETNSHGGSTVTPPSTTRRTHCFATDVLRSPAKNPTPPDRSTTRCRRAASSSATARIVRNSVDSPRDLDDEGPHLPCGRWGPSSSRECSQCLTGHPPCVL